MGKYFQGIFKPKNPHKYKGDVNNIIYRSSWELTCLQKFDSHPGIISYSSEETVIPYISPIDGKRHRYFVDFTVEVLDKDNKRRKILIEVKPKKQTTPPAPRSGKPTKGYINEVKTWGVNSAKWQAARNVCELNGWEFQILTEEDLYGKK